MRYLALVLCVLACGGNDVAPKDDIDAAVDGPAAEPATARLTLDEMLPTDVVLEHEGLTLTLGAGTLVTSFDAAGTRLAGEATLSFRRLTIADEPGANGAAIVLSVGGVMQRAEIEPRAAITVELGSYDASSYDIGRLFDDAGFVDDVPGDGLAAAQVARRIPLDAVTFSPVVAPETVPVDSTGVFTIEKFDAAALAHAVGPTSTVRVTVDPVAAAFARLCALELIVPTTAHVLSSDLPNIVVGETFQGQSRHIDFTAKLLDESGARVIEVTSDRHNELVLAFTMCEGNAGAQRLVDAQGGCPDEDCLDGRFAGMINVDVVAPDILAADGVRTALQQIDPAAQVLLRTFQSPGISRVTYHPREASTQLITAIPGARIVNRGARTLALEPPAAPPCSVSNAPVPGNDQSSRSAFAAGSVIENGTVSGSETDTGTNSASIDGNAGGGEFEASATVTASSQRLVAKTMGTSATLSVSATAQTTLQRRIATVSGSGTGRARIRARVSGTKGAKGTVSFSMDFDSTDELDDTGTQASVFLASGAAASVQRILTIDANFSFNSGSATPVYMETAFSGLDDVNVQVTILETTVSVLGCQ